MDIYKINKHYSLYLFFLIILIIVPLVKMINVEIQYTNLFCFFLISTIGIMHGSLDNIKGIKILKFYGIKNKYLFYLSYVFISILVIGLWFILPNLILSIFLLIAAYHFGKEDCNCGIKIENKFVDFFYLLKGSIVILAPLFLKKDQTIEIFETINYQLLLVSNEQLILPLIFLSFVSNFFLAYWGKSNGFIIADWFTIIALNATFSPLVAFTIYFCFLHSVRHSLSLIYEINKISFNKGLTSFLKKSLPLTFITCTTFIIGVYVLNNYFSLNSAVLKVVFIGLASLTFPHILLEYLLEKNEKRA